MSNITSDYLCKECGKEVNVVDGKFIRSCQHNNAPIIASMTAVATGEGTAK